jgi:predicted ATPase
MNYVVGLCGTHGTGKSTILQSVKAAGFPSNETQLSRKAQAELGWDSLARAQESADNMWKLQNAILSAMAWRDVEIQVSKKKTIVERTPADTWAYTSMWCNRLGIDVFTDRHAVAYRTQCIELARQYAKFVYVPPMDEIPFVADPHRADLASRQFVATTIDNFLWSNELPTYKIKSSSPAGRASEALEVMITSR